LFVLKATWCPLLHHSDCRWLTRRGWGQNHINDCNRATAASSSDAFIAAAVYESITMVELRAKTPLRFSSIVGPSATR
jgi:hypothetical protein